MNIKVNSTKEITDPLKKEMVWRAIGHTQDLIDNLYRVKDGTWHFTDEKMEEIFYKLNEMAIDLANDKDMAWQLEEENEHTGNE